MLRPMLLTLFAAGLTTPALALDTWMWGLGPRIGTQVLPGGYPNRLPRLADGDPDSGPRTDDGIVQMPHDLMLGGRGVYYIDRHHRIGFDGGTMIGLGMGQGRRGTTWDFLFTYDYAFQGKALDLMLGGGAGFGTTGFRGPDDQRLRVNTFPVRVQVSGMARDNTRAYELGVFAQYNTPSSTTYTLPSGDQPNVRGGIWFTTGLQISVFFGDFNPPTGTPGPVRRLPED